MGLPNSGESSVTEDLFVRAGVVIFLGGVGLMVRAS